MTDQIPDRIKATLTINLDFAKEDQDKIVLALNNIIDSLSIGSSGKGSVTPSSHYDFKLDSNLPSEPMTLDRMFDLVNQSLEPGELTVQERYAEMNDPLYEVAEAWIQTLSDDDLSKMAADFPNARSQLELYKLFIGIINIKGPVDQTIMDILKDIEEGKPIPFDKEG